METLWLVLGDQLDRSALARHGFSPKADGIWMAEVAHESTKVWTHKARIVLFLSAMRHYRDELLQQGYDLQYVTLEDPHNTQTLGGELHRYLETCQLETALPKRLAMVEAGEWSVQEELYRVAESWNLPLEIFSDGHFLCTRAQFNRHAQGRKQLRMEFFYREMRRQMGMLMTPEGTPEGGEWNYDGENRKSFPNQGKQKGPPLTPVEVGIAPDVITKEVIEVVHKRFSDHPGDLESFDWPVTPQGAELLLAKFIAHHLPYFGTYQDAMWTQQPFLYHSRLSAAMNLKLISPQQIIRQVEAAYYEGKVSLESAEGFIRQILGWREYVRGVYWLHMPQYLHMNALEAQEELPPFYWTGKTKMVCLSQVIGQTLQTGYAHHIQRLMVTGLYALLFGVQPHIVHQWYLAVYVDAVEWVELPNALGMSQYGDGGIMGSKPYVATGKYIQKMSNYCGQCPYDPTQRTGPQACPFTTLYWDFLLRHEVRFKDHPRMALQMRNLDRLSPEEKQAIQREALAHRASVRTE